MQNVGRHRVAARDELRQQRIECAERNLAAEPAEARDEDELELGDHGAGRPQEQVVEAPVLEVILDPRAADPTDPAVDDQHLAVVDVPETGKVPAGRAAGVERPERCTCPGASHDTDLDAACEHAAVEVARLALGARSLAVDHEPDGNAGRGLLDQRGREPVTDEPGPEAELVDVD